MDWDPRRTALVICDMWNDHWCKSAARRCAALAPQVNEFAKAARALGILIIHAPSDTMAFYAGMPQRTRAQAVGALKPHVPIRMHGPDAAREPALPIDDSDGGCDDVPPCTFSVPWIRQHPAILIGGEDLISDSGAEIYSLLTQRDIRNVFIAGVHANKCVLARPFGIRQLVTLGMNVALVRDLTDSLYNPLMSPGVTHERGTELVVEHIEKYWCPSIDSRDITSPHVGSCAPA
jgi:nicotinamidase-related amidase